MDRLLEPELLKSFVAIAETGSFTDAASRVHRTQSAVSMQMRRLEASVGRRLFAKAGRGVELSPDGELLLAHARRLLTVHREVLAAFDGEGLDGRVRIGAPDDYASTFLPPILARFATTHPRVEVEVVCETSARLVEGIGAETLDLALVTQGSGETAGVVLHREPLVWVGSPAHPVHELESIPLALFHSGCLFRQAALAALAAHGRNGRIAYTSVSVAGVCAAISAGLAIGVLCRSAVPPGLRILGEREGLPELPQTTVVLVRRRGPGMALLDACERHILASFAAAPILKAA
jgi:DNA-binding transcriptional LysR family regulator